MNAVAERPFLLRVAGMWCTSCSRATERVLQKQPGVRGARVSFATGVAVVDGDPALVSEDRLVAAVRALGYEARPYTPEASGLEGDDGGLRVVQMRLAVSVPFAMWTMVAQLVLYASPPGELDADVRRWVGLAAGVLATPVVFVGGWGFLRAGLRTLRAGVPGMDFLVALGALGAWGLSAVELARGAGHTWFDTAAMLVTFLLVGRLVEHAVRRRGADAVRRLLDLTPEAAWRVDGDAIREVPAADVPPGAVVEVRPGARVPLDGLVVAGRSRLDRSPLTGESRPMPVGEGDRVHAGCLNGQGVLRVRVEGAVGSRRIDRIAEQVRDAVDQRTELQAVAQRFAERLTPVVLALAVTTGLVTWLWTGQGAEAVLRAVAVLVVTCPCALGLATPVALAVAVGRAASRGIVFRGAEALQRAAEVEAVAFDKTGTLTEGRPRVVAFDSVAGVATSRLLDVAAAAEAGSEHPVGRAIREARSVGDLPGIREAVIGRGVVWTRADGSVVRVGSRAWFADLPFPATGDTEVWVEDGGRLLGRLVLADAPRAEAAPTVARLVAEGRRVALLSGDAAAVVRRVAASVGITEARGEQSPEEKAAWVAAAQRDGARVAFVGDGINDAPALASAHLGIAVAGSTDAAAAVAPIVLQAGGAERVAEALALARRTLRVMRQNLGWAVGYNALAVPLAMSGLVRPEVAALAMVASSLTVTLNALRLRAPAAGA